ncbi:MAG: H+-transporting two-sector ATPase, epsilon subunit [Microgenomates group bacterium GW2011_GWC1_41_8]|uniref:H+-transporting two-sector ATPase, epsilon subunit n=4 Tax=Microgenomates group TaxID=1794810 RepID=A0A0G0X9M4_9BACT|nr:MAG: H+-transporting two-sector ATPase, epsilon subunit [Candidatus Roizmanbacteria bacterium GW2011_GWB1_40_7]KKR93875.1 MAG: H+-transporting two-sector ATPase, epsilon subunit [Candidatus Roizmanbacteria bacterium GW2011_GWA1_41_13]KKS21625.1 MAG: H+-transporting two-sector ATPase, epsilon subunit [Candidatus Roizmanbacteria bacterium GW2011_GWC2_41_7]KKS23473.1 MAG: H+-transporting two-sector ATPase, epsilon subunit [Microgenomates group bacterium GW2011_GWC1_41_8]KKS45444.1 MAG: H+-trans
MLTVTINTPEKIVWHGKADSVSSENSQGPFDILSQHANLITLVENKPILVRFGKREHRFDFKRCVIFTQNDYVACYAI